MKSLLQRRLAVLVGLVAILVAAQDHSALAWSLEQHWAMTEEVLIAQGWANKDARDFVIDCNMAVDLADLSAFTGFFASLAYPCASAQRERVRTLAGTAGFNTYRTNGFHFDDLFTFDDADTRWTDLEEWAQEQVAAAVAGGWGEEATKKFLCIMGTTFHAIQDFYAHSNWVALLNEFTESGDFDPDEFPKWEELVNNEGNWQQNHPNFRSQDALDKLQLSNTTTSTSRTGGGLQTGSWSVDKVNGIKPWRHQHPSGQEATVALALAKRATHQWKEKLIGWLSDDDQDLLIEYVTTVASTTCPQRVDSASTDALLIVLDYFKGPLAQTEEVNSVFQAENVTQGFLLESGSQCVAEFILPGFLEPTLYMITDSSATFQRIIIAPDPLAEAIEASNAGKLSVTNTPPGHGCSIQGDDCMRYGFGQYDGLPYNQPGPDYANIYPGATLTYTLAPYNCAVSYLPTDICKALDTLCFHAYSRQGWTVAADPPMGDLYELPSGYVWYQSVSITAPCDAEPGDHDTLIARVAYANTAGVCDPACEDCADPNIRPTTGVKYYNADTLVVTVIAAPPALGVLQDTLTLVDRGQTQAFVPFTICNQDECAPPTLYGYNIKNVGVTGRIPVINQSGSVTVSGGECKDVYGIIDAGLALACDYDTLTIIVWTPVPVVYDTCVQVIHIVEPQSVPLFTVPVVTILVLALILAAAVFMRRRAVGKA